MPRRSRIALAGTKYGCRLLGLDWLKYSIGVR